MSNTCCRFCDITIQGIYLNCPRCGKWLPPTKGKSISSEPFQIVSYGDSWQTAKPKPDKEKV